MSAACERASVPTARTAEWPVWDGEPPRSPSGRRDVAIAGIPRSGSTLACHLLNGFPDAVALHEPFSLSGFRRWSELGVGAERALRGIEAFYEAARRSLRERGQVVSKHAGGEIPDNPIGPEGGGSASVRTLMRRASRRLGGAHALRRGRVVRGVVRVRKPLSDDFLLCVKHPSIFTSLLPQLVERLPCFATVRNPVALLGSWNSVEYAVSEGRSRAAERLDPRLARELGRCRDRSERQLRLLEWYFERIARWVPPARVLRYEDVVASGGGIFSRIAGTAAPLDAPLESRNKSADYDAELVLELGEQLLAAPGAWSAFYSAGCLESLLAELEEGTRAQAAPSGSAPLPSPFADADESRGRP